MKRVVLSISIVILCKLVIAQVPQGFNYQAIALDGSTPITTTLPVRITIQADPAGGTIFWVEEHSTITPNSSGLFKLIVGTGTRISGLTSFSDIDWTVSPKYIMTEINYGGWKTMGSSGLWAVPYSMVAGDLGGSLDKLKVKGKTTSPDSALFEVKNNTGQTIFAVYNEGVRVYVDDGVAKGAKGGFAIGGFGTNKAASQDLFVVNADSIRAYIGTNPAKGAKGGFAIGGFNAAKAPGEEYLRVTRDSTRVYIADPAVKGAKGGFAIGGFSQVKGPVYNYFNLTPNNYFIGQLAGYSNSTGLHNSYIGYRSGYTNQSGNYNTYLGFETGFYTLASYNTFIGYQAGYTNNTGYNNVFLGNQAGFSNTIGYNNVIMGTSAGYMNSSGYNNTFIGNSAGYSNTSGFFNIFIGEQAGISNTTGALNVFLGQLAGRYNTTGQANVFIGQQTGEANTTGNFNLFAGRAAGSWNTTGQLNTSLGINAGNVNTTGNDNVNLGGESGKWNSTGSNNVNLGTGAGYGNTNGSNNINIGYYTGVSLTTGIGNIFIGPGAGGGLTNTSDKLFIENSYADVDNALIYGDFAADYLKLNANVDIRNKLNITSGNNWDLVNGEGDFKIGNSLYRLKMGVALSGGGAGAAGIMQYGQTGGYNVLAIGAQGNNILFINGGSQNVGIGTDNPGYKLTVFGTAWCSGGAWTGSDIRWKKNISDLKNSLEGILSLQTVNYDLRTEEFPEMGFDSGNQIGLIAQDVEKVFPMLVNTDKNGYKAVAYDKLSAILVEGMKEQQQQIESQQKEIDELKTLVNKLIFIQTGQANF